jgi:hypothetical protein
MFESGVKYHNLTHPICAIIPESANITCLIWTILVFFQQLNLS